MRGNDAIELSTLTQTVLGYVRDRIITGEFSPGSKLNESEIASRLKISRHPLREALRVLENEYLVVSIPRKGAHVTSISVEALEEIYQVREMMECFSIRLLENKEVRDLHQVRSAVALSSDLPIPSVDDPEGMLRFHSVFADFHIKLIEATGNHFLLNYYKTLAKNLTRYQCLLLAIPGRADKSVNQHKEIIRQIENGDYAGACTSMKKHIGDSLERLKANDIFLGMSKQRSGA